MNWNNWSIRRRINAGFAAITLIALAFGLFAIVQLGWIKTDTGHIMLETLPAMDRAGNLAEQFQSLGDKSSVLFIKEIMSPSDDLRAELATQIQTNLASVDKLAKDYVTHVQDAEEKSLFSSFQSSLAGYEQVFRHGIELCSAGKSQEAMELKESQLEPALDNLMTSVHKLEGFNRARGEAAGMRIQAAVSTAQRGLWTGVIGLLLAAGAISLAIIFSTIKILNRVAVALNGTTERMSVAGAQVAGSSQAVADNASHQASSIQEVSASLEQMIAISKNNADQAKLATDIAQQTHETAANGVKSMVELDTAVQDINAASGDIAKIVRTIDEIAFQTNILALNAAVEAARAGEAGMGFAVVADEVRNLAQRSAQAAKETAGRIEATISKASKGAELSKRLKNNFDEILNHAREVDKIDQTVAGISKQQAEGISHINVGVAQLDKVTQSNAANAEESASAAAELKVQTDNLKLTVAELVKLIGSSTTVTIADEPDFHGPSGHHDINGPDLPSRNGKLTVPAREPVSI